MGLVMGSAGGLTVKPEQEKYGRVQTMEPNDVLVNKNYPFEKQLSGSPLGLQER